MTHATTNEIQMTTPRRKPKQFRIIIIINIIFIIIIIIVVVVITEL
jgi:t-SNARE complex subunit (syntaxin)